jgi:hypothetical protein
MGSLSDSIRGRITSTNNKYNNKQEKKAIVIKGNQSDNLCIISSVTRDGIPQIFYNVPVIYTSDDDSVKWFPKDGEEVCVVENNKNYSITGPVIKNAVSTTPYDIYSMGPNDISGNLQ